jgi:putative ABC transport system substrate-binding protein
MAVRRRDFIKAIAGLAVAWPLIARAQQSGRMRRIGVLEPLAADDPEAEARHKAFVEALQQFGWTVGQNVQLEYRSAGGDPDRLRTIVAELIALAPDVILSQSSNTLAALLQATRTIPIVFTVVADPVGAGYVDSLAHPGGNATGFTNFEYSIAGKWLELLKEIAPRITQVAVLRDPSIAAGPGQFAAIQSAAEPRGVELRPINVRDAGEIEKAITAFAGVANGGLIVTGSPTITFHRALIIDLAARYRLPAVYNTPLFARAGGLMAYGSNVIDEFPRAAQYVDRILKGEKPADLPVQSPTKYDLIINLKTAKVLGIDVPSSLVARANEVIE